MKIDGTTRVARVDRWKVKMDAGLPTDSRGFARIWGTVIRANSVLEYGPPDGHPDGHREFVPESTVFDERAIDTLRNAPITFLHPAEPVTADNSVRVTVGHIIDVQRDGLKLRALHQIEDAQAIDRIRGGVIELSPGYTTRLESANGLVVDGVEVHAIQREREYNHNAIVPEARAGHDNALTIDARILPADGLRIQTPGETMFKITIDGKTVEVDADALAQIQKLTGGLGKADQEEEEEEEEEDAKDKGDEGDDEDEDAKDAKDKSEDAPPSDPPSPANDGPKVDAKELAAEVAKIALGEIRSGLKADRAAVSRTGQIVEGARSIMPSGHTFEGKSDAQIMRSAIKEKDADLAARAKHLDGDALFGFFQAVMVGPSPNRTDGASTFKQPKNSYADAIEFRNKRADAMQSCGVTGDGAVNSPPILKLVFGEG